MLNTNVVSISLTNFIVLRHGHINCCMQCNQIVLMLGISHGTRIRKSPEYLSKQRPVNWTTGSAVMLPNYLQELVIGTASHKILVSKSVLCRRPLLQSMHHNIRIWIIMEFTFFISSGKTSMVKQNFQILPTHYLQLHLRLTNTAYHVYLTKITTHHSSKMYVILE